MKIIEVLAAFVLLIEILVFVSMVTIILLAKTII